jgi:hypothetical protein
MDDDLNSRVRRIYAALAHVIGESIVEVVATHSAAGGLQFFAVDFREGLTDEEISNRVYSVISNIANLEGHLIRWVRAKGLNADLVRTVVDRSAELKLIIDLANNDKHGYPPRDGGRSGHSPRLVGLDRWLAMTTLPEAGSTVSFTIGRDGIGQIGGGSAKVVITGAIVAGDGEPLGDLDAAIEASISVWEQFMKTHAA